MEKFGMNFGVAAGKKELLETIETQKKQLLQYQTRLKDVVRAYKSLLKEKEALEASLKVLSVSHEADAGLDNGDGASVGEAADDVCSLHSEDSVGTATSLTSFKGELTEEEHLGTDLSAANESALPKTEEANSSESGISTGSGECVLGAASDTDRRVLQLKNKLATLTNALATVTQEKSRMEASYLADKRKTKQEKDDLCKKASDDKRLFEEELKSTQDQLAETKARLITQQHDRAQEQNDHAVMLRELQKLLQAERDQRQDIELKLEDMRGSLAGRVYLAERLEEYEAQVMQLNHELEERTRELRAVQEERVKPDPQVQEMLKEMANIKTHFQSQLQHEMTKIYTLTYIYLAILPFSLLGSGSVIVVSILKRICLQSQVRPLFILSISDFLAASFLIITALIQLLPRLLYVNSYHFCVYGIMLALMFYAVSFLMVIVYAFEVCQAMRSLRNARAPTEQEDSRPDVPSWLYPCYGLAWLIPLLLFLVQLISRTSSMTDIVPVHLGDYSSSSKNQSGNRYDLFCSSCIILIHNSGDFCYQYVKHEYVNLGEKATFFAYLLLVMTCCTFLYCGSDVSHETNERTPLMRGTRGSHGSYRAIQLFRIVFVFCWGPAFLLSVLSFTTVKPSSLYALFVIQALTVSLQGLLNSLAYGWSRQNFRQEVIGHWRQLNFSKRFFEDSIVFEADEDRNPLEEQG